MSTVYQACKHVGRQPSSFSGFLIMRGGRINQMSSKSCVSCSCPAASLESSKENFAAWLCVWVCCISPRSHKDRTISDLCSWPVPGCLSRGTRVPLPGHCRLAPSAWWGFGKALPSRQSPARSWSSELSCTALRLSPSLLPLLGQRFSLGLQAESRLR